MNLDSICVTRLVPRQATVTVVSAPLQTVSQSAGQSNVSDSSVDANGLSAGWVVAIISLVILAISLSVNVFFYRSRRRSKRGRYGRDRPADSMYYDITKPARTYSRRDRDRTSFMRR